MRARRQWFRAIATATAVAIAVVAAVLGTRAPDQTALETGARMLMVIAPVAAGLYAVRRPPFERFSVLLIATGAAWALAGLSASPNELIHSIGRVSAWCVEVGVIYLLLAFPTGRLAGIDRALVGALALVVALLYVPTALLVESYPTPSPYAACGADCAGNAFMVVSTQPAFVDDWVVPLRELLTLALVAAATLRLGWRIERASHVMKRALTLVLAVAIFRLLALATGIVARTIAPDGAAAEIAAWLIALSLPILALAFLGGLVRWRLFIAAAMERLATRLRGHPSPDDLRDALADAFDDPTLEVLYWLREPVGHWADASGRAIELGTLAPGRSFTRVFDGDQLVAGILHDPVLHADRAFADSATAYAVMTLDNHRLSAQTTALLDEARESRARIQAAADDERRRIEHDLHDGAQQRLVAVRIKLELAAERAAADDRASADLLRAMGREIDEALDEIRLLARGIYPAPLAARGLVEALRSAALQSAIPTTVLAEGVGRYSRAIEAAAYFCCLEAMQNTAKHADGATATVVELRFNGSLVLEVRDDGAGFDPGAANGGVGLTGMRDRLAAVGGWLAIISRPGHGTRVRATIPLAPVAAPAARPTATPA
jgi:signal transduction histidine kinase